MNAPAKYVRVTSSKPFAYDRARFYPVDNLRFPSVTTVLDIIAKPALGPWYAKMERKAFEDAILLIASKADSITTEKLLDEVIKAVAGAKAGDKQKQKAADVGTAAHAWIEWETKRRMGKDIGPEPKIPDASQVSVMAWQDWAKKVDFKPMRSEITVVSRQWGYAGTADWIGRVRGRVTLGDYKTSKAVYPESYLQNIAYRNAAREMGAKVQDGLILRLPKTLEDPAFEAAPVPDVPFLGFVAALHLWRCMRQLEGKDIGDMPANKNNNGVIA